MAAEASSPASILLEATQACQLAAQVPVAVPAAESVLVEAAQPASWPAVFPATVTEPDALTSPAESPVALTSNTSSRHDISSTKQTYFAVAEAPAYAVQNESALRNLTTWPPPVSYSSSKAVAAEAREAALAEAKAAVHHRPLSVATMQRLMSQVHTLKRMAPPATSD